MNLTDDQVQAIFDGWQALLDKAGNDHDVNDEVTQMFLFGLFDTVEDRDAAFALMPYGDEIKGRMDTIYNFGRTAEELGGAIPAYTCPSAFNKAAPADIERWIRDYYKQVARLMGAESELSEGLQAFMATDWTVTQGLDPDAASDAAKQMNEEIEYGYGDAVFDLCDFGNDIFSVVHEFGVYMAKVDEVTYFVCNPWFRHFAPELVDEKTFEPEMLLYNNNIRFWIHDESGLIGWAAQAED